ncbi:MAG: DUF3179 domain-containing protein [Planctomycetes bacterium]|nr:DUF3179 domain-containing protein [Planctomycetota bacterium]
MRDMPVRRRAIGVLVLVVFLGGCAASSSSSPSFAQRKARHEPHKQRLLTKFDLSDPRLDIDDLFSPGVDRDGIVALDEPERWNIGEASFPDDDGRVIEVSINGESVAYPLAIMGVHEIVNDTVGETPIAVTYCPLCDSASVIDRRLPGGGTTEFGVSGMLYRSNLTMYDRSTNSLWSQVGMTALTGPHAGESLHHRPVRIISFGEFKARHPDGQVLSVMTGHDEDYRLEDDHVREYLAGDGLYMPVVHGDTLPPKTLGVGIIAGDYTAFVSAEAARDEPVRLETASGLVVVAAGDSGMTIVEAPSDVLTVQSLYFAWTAFHPESLVFGPRPARTLLDGSEKSFVVVGYSTSYAWPAMLQDMLDQHAGGERRYHVLNAVIGGAAVERWIGDPSSSDYARTVAAMVRDYFGPDARLRGEAPEPSIALCQQSLQFTGSLRGPVTSPGDEAGIRLGAIALETLSRRLRDLGLERVYIGMHIYKKPVEPEVGNERLALAALLAGGLDWVYEGPDVWTPTYEGFPGCFDDDELHPNELGMKIMAEHWYRTVAGPDTRQDVIDRLYARSYDVDTMMRHYIASRRRDLQ